MNTQTMHSIIDHDEMTALIKQLGEALLLAMRGAELSTTIENSFDIDDALIAYNNWKRERGE